MAARSKPHFFGRRKGKSLRPRQAALTDNLLPGLRIDLETLPAVQVALAEGRKDLWLEIGFGGGEHLAADAQSHPDVHFIGCEPFVNGVAKLVSTIDENKIRNIRIHDGDALEVLRALPDASLGRVTILYPDPWPKFGQRKRRFVSPETIQQMARTL
jgi:tRNA (guanine-N7-)-methyltransferase